MMRRTSGFVLRIIPQLTRTSLLSPFILFARFTDFIKLSKQSRAEVLWVGSVFMNPRDRRAKRWLKLSVSEDKGKRSSEPCNAPYNFDVKFRVKAMAFAPGLQVLGAEDWTVGL